MHQPNRRELTQAVTGAAVVGVLGIGSYWAGAWASGPEVTPAAPSPRRTGTASPTPSGSPSGSASPTAASSAGGKAPDLVGQPLDEVARRLGGRPVQFRWVRSPMSPSVISQSPKPGDVVTGPVILTVRAPGVVRPLGSVVRGLPPATALSRAGKSYPQSIRISPQQVGAGVQLAMPATSVRLTAWLWVEGGDDPRGQYELVDGERRVWGSAVRGPSARRVTIPLTGGQRLTLRGVRPDSTTSLVLGQAEVTTLA